jgi:hypothetical protein
MSYTLEAFAEDCRKALKAYPGRAGREQVRGHVERALKDAKFVNRYLSRASKERDIIYEDKELGFCICAHVYSDARQGKPHDHGPTWAIYGQAVGETEMTDWRIVTPANDGQPAKVERVRSYRMKPGDAHLYEVGDVHAPLRDGPTKLIRIEGVDTMKVKRTPIEAMA